MKNNIMTQKQKDLLLEDLCARLPYGVVIHFDEKTNQDDERLYGIRENGGKFLINDAFYIEEIKPHLFPLSSMTEEQKEEIEDKLIFPSNSNGGWIEILCNGKYEIPFWFVDFCNKNHFDYRGLIPMGLANDATGLNIY